MRNVHNDLRTFRSRPNAHVDLQCGASTKSGVTAASADAFGSVAVTVTVSDGTEGPEHGLELRLPVPGGGVVGLSAGTPGVQVGDGADLASFSPATDSVAVRPRISPATVGQAQVLVQLLDATGTALGSAALSPIGTVQNDRIIRTRCVGREPEPCYRPRDMARFRPFLPLALLAGTVIWPTPAAAGCLDSPNVVELVACVRGQMRGSGAGLDRPSPQQWHDLADVMAQMLAGQAAPALPASLQGIMEARAFVDGGNGRTYFVLLEVADLDADGLVDRGFGTFVVDPEAVRELAIAIPHPIYDLDTRVQGIEVFRAVGARSFLMAGTHRNASGVPSACQPSYRESDAAHNADLMFLAGTQALRDYYGARRWHQIQFHGLGSASCPDTDVFISNGEHLVAPAAEGVAAALRGRLLADHPTWRVALDGGGCDYDGGSNVAGRLIGGVPLDQVCSLAPAARVETFIHIEQKSGFRSSADWIPAIRSVWPEEPRPHSRPPRRRLLRSDTVR